MKSVAHFVALCIAMSVAASAAAEPKERWLVAKASGGTLAYNAETLGRDPKTGFVTLASALYLTKSQKNADGLAFQYVLSEDRLNCADNTFQAVTRVLLDDNQSIVDQLDLDAEPWRPTSANAPLAFLHGVACNGDNIGNAREAASIENALNLMKTMAK